MKGASEQGKKGKKGILICALDASQVRWNTTMGVKLTYKVHHGASRPDGRGNPC